MLLGSEFNLKRGSDLLVLPILIAIQFDDGIYVGRWQVLARFFGQSCHVLDRLIQQNKNKADMAAIKTFLEMARVGEKYYCSPN